MIARENKGPGIGIEYAYSRAATSVANPSPQQVAGLRQSIWVAGDTGAGAGAPESILFDLTKSRQCAGHPAAAGPAPASPRHHAEDLHQAERALPGPGGGPALHLQAGQPGQPGTETRAISYHKSVYELLNF